MVRHSVLFLHSRQVLLEALYHSFLCSESFFASQGFLLRNGKYAESPWGAGSRCASVSFGNGAVILRRANCPNRGRLTGL